MVLHRRPGPPQGLQVAGHGAGGVDDDVVGAHELVEGPEDLRLGRQRPVAQVVAALGGGEPGLALGGDLAGVVLADAVAVQGGGERPQGLAGVGHDHLGALLGGVEGRDIDIDEAHPRVLELGLGGGGEVRVPGAHADDQVGLVGEVVARVPAGGAHRPDGAGVVVVDGALARLGVGHRDAGGGGQGAQLLAGLGVDGAAPGDDQGTLGRPDEGDGALEGGGLGHRPAHVPHALAEQLDRPVVGLGLDVLGHGQDDGSGLGGVGEHPHGAQQRGDELLGAVDPVEEAGHGAEAVVDRDVETGGVLQLLEDRVGHAGGELVGGQQQDRDPVGGGQGGAGDHIERTGADGGGDHVRRHPVADLGEGRGGVDGALLVAGHDVGHLALARVGGDLVLQQRLADAGDVAVPEDAQGALDEAVLDAVALGVLVGQEADGRLGDRQADGAGVGFIAHDMCSSLAGLVRCVDQRVIGRRGSISWSSQVPRIQWWAGSSGASHARSSSGPAMTLR